MPNKINSCSMAYKTEQPDPSILLQEKIEKIFDEVSDGNLDNFKKLLDEGIDVNVKNEYGETLLHYAYRWGQVEIIDVLLEWPGIDLNVRNADDNTILDEAMLVGDVELTKKILDSGKIDQNYRNKSGLTLLDIAVIDENPDMLDLILQLEWIDVNSVGENNSVSLNYVNSKEIAEKLIAAGADVSKARDSEELNALLNSKDVAVPEIDGESGEDMMRIVSNAEMV